MKRKTQIKFEDSSDDDDLPLSSGKFVNSSDDDDDALPLSKRIKHLSKECNIKNCRSSLCRRSHEICDFCDKVFNNKYDSLKHNAKHIIIPLLKLQVYECNQCLFCFTSLEELNHHTIKHQSKFYDRVPAKNIKYEIINLDDDEESVENDIEIYDEEKSVGNNIEKYDEKTSEENIIENGENVLIQKIDAEVIEIDNEENVEKTRHNGVKNRIVFEDDSDLEDDLITFDSNDILNNFMNDCKVNIDIFDPPWLFSKDLMLEQEYKDLLEKSPPQIEYESVHYDDLMKPGLYRCKQCEAMFPNRFETIKHETTHMKMKKQMLTLCTVCERFIAGNHYSLKRHSQEKHPEVIRHRKLAGICTKCGLKYARYERHVRNYHEIYVCSKCEKRFETESERDGHFSECLEKQDTKQEARQDARQDTKTVKACDVCYTFMKNRMNCHYTVIDEVSEVGVRQVCSKCGGKFFEVKLVQMTTNKNTDRLEGEKEKKRPLSNADRLKNIQKRLKMLNKLTRF